jgi:histidinol phosphatase-like enzyme
VLQADDVKLIDGAAAAVHALHRDGWRVSVVTNQVT